MTEAPIVQKTGNIRDHRHERVKNRFATVHRHPKIIANYELQLLIHGYDNNMEIITNLKNTLNENMHLRDY